MPALLKPKQAFADNVSKRYRRGTVPNIPQDIKVDLDFDATAQSYSAVCLNLDNVSSYAKTKEKALSNLRGAILCHFDLEEEDLEGVKFSIV